MEDTREFTPEEVAELRIIGGQERGYAGHTTEELAKLGLEDLRSGHYERDEKGRVVKVMPGKWGD